MSDNVIKFRNPQPPKKPRPGQSKLLAVIIGGIALCALIWVHFQYGMRLKASSARQKPSIFLQDSLQRRQTIPSLRPQIKTQSIGASKSHCETSIIENSNAAEKTLNVHQSNFNNEGNYKSRQINDLSNVEWRDSNSRPSGPQPDALPDCATLRRCRDRGDTRLPRPCNS